MCDLCTAFYKELQVFTCHECGVRYIPQGEIEDKLNGFIGWIAYSHNQRYLCPSCLKTFEINNPHKYYVTKEQIKLMKKRVNWTKTWMGSNNVEGMP